MSPYFFGDGCWILAKKAGTVLKGFSLVQFVFDIDTENIKLLVKNVDGYSIMFLTDNQELSVILVF